MEFISQRPLVSRNVGRLGFKARPAGMEKVTRRKWKKLHAVDAKLLADASEGCHQQSEWIVQTDEYIASIFSIGHIQPAHHVRLGTDAHAYPGIHLHPSEIIL